MVLIKFVLIKNIKTSLTVVNSRFVSRVQRTEMILFEDLALDKIFDISKKEKVFFSQRFIANM